MAKACTVGLTMSDKLVKIARSWIGTPYIHQQSSKGNGTDCLGLLRGIWRESLGEEPEMTPVYTADWSESTGDERLWVAAQRHLLPVPIDPRALGQVALFRVFRSAVAKHLAITALGPDGTPTIIHAYSGKGVVETALTPAWSSRIVAQFRFPIGTK